MSGLLPTSFSYSFSFSGGISFFLVCSLRFPENLARLIDIRHRHQQPEPSAGKGIVLQEGRNRSRLQQRPRRLGLLARREDRSRGQIFLFLPLYLLVDRFLYRVFRFRNDLLRPLSYHYRLSRAAGLCDRQASARHLSVVALPRNLGQFPPDER